MMREDIMRTAINTLIQFVMPSTHTMLGKRKTSEIQPNIISVSLNNKSSPYYTLNNKKARYN